MKKFILALLFLFLLASIVSAKEINEYETVGKYMAAFEKKDLELAVSYSNQNDNEALKSMYDQMKIFILKPGLTVYLVDSSWSGLVEVRPRGKTFTIWTFKEAIE